MKQAWEDYECLDQVEVPDIDIPRYQEMMRCCMVKRAEKLALTDESDSLISRNVWFTGAGLTLASVLILVAMFGLPQVGGVSSVPQARAEDLVTNAVDHSDDEVGRVLRQALSAKDLQIVASVSPTRSAGHQRVAYSSAVAYAASPQGVVVATSTPEFRVNVFPGSLVNTSSGIYGGVRFVRFTDAQGETVTLGINGASGEVESIQVESIQVEPVMNRNVSSLVQLIRE